MRWFLKDQKKKDIWGSVNDRPPDWLTKSGDREGGLARQGDGAGEVAGAGQVGRGGDHGFGAEDQGRGRQNTQVSHGALPSFSLRRSPSPGWGEQRSRNSYHTHWLLSIPSERVVIKEIPGRPVACRESTSLGVWVTPRHEPFRASALADRVQAVGIAAALRVQHLGVAQTLRALRAHLFGRLAQVHELVAEPGLGGVERLVEGALGAGHDGVEHLGAGRAHGSQLLALGVGDGAQGEAGQERDGDGRRRAGAGVLRLRGFHCATPLRLRFNTLPAICRNEKRGFPLEYTFLQPQSVAIL